MSHFFVSGDGSPIPVRSIKVTMHIALVKHLGVGSYANGSTLSTYMRMRYSTGTIHGFIKIM